MAHIASRIIRSEHSALAAVLRSLDMMVAKGPGDEPDRFFDVLRAMLFYIDEFPERLHHPKESELLFARLAQAAPELRPVLCRLEAEHIDGERRVRELQHLLLGWELVGETRRAAFVDAAEEYVRFYLKHMQIEETQLLPRAEEALTEADWTALDEAFMRDRDPLASGQHDATYERLFTRIVMTAPQPIGVGASLDRPG